MSSSYQYSCPLCLTKLGPGQALIAFKVPDLNVAKKSSRQPKKRFECGQPDYIDKILKYGGEYAFIPGKERALYLSHERCDAPNPFWDKSNNQLSIPGNPDDGEMLPVDIKCERTGRRLQKELYHWVVLMLRNAVALGNNYKPMWFPFPLLLATATNGDKSLKRPYGSLVEMASTREVGKTILTLQILNQALYRNGRSLTLSDYFYPSADHEDKELKDFKEKFFKELYFHCMWKKTPPSRPLGTVPSPGDLRAVFIQPVEAEESAEVEVKPKARKGRLRRWVKTPFSWVALFIKVTIFDTKGKKSLDVPSLGKILEEQKDEFWTPVLFYDTAGESQEKMSPVTMSVRQITNKLAICIDAREIFNYEGTGEGEDLSRDRRNASIKHAYKRLSEMNMARALKKPTCILVTKLDLIKFKEEQKREVESVAEDSKDEDGAKKLLIQWLEEYRDDDKGDLLDLLRRKNDLVDRVFLVWTKNLPEMRGARFSPIKEFTPPRGKVGDIVTINANSGFDFNDAKQITFNGVPGDLEIKSEKLIEARVPEGASSGFIGIRLEGFEKNDVTGAKDKAYVDVATSETVFEIAPGGGRDAAKPHSHGLIKFLAWCLDRSVEDISWPTGK